MITAFYMFRLIFKTFHGKPANKNIFSHITESPLAMTIPLVLLSILSLAFVFTIHINPFHDHVWLTHHIGHINHVAGLNMHEVQVGMHNAHDSAMFISLLVVFSGIVISSLFYLLNKVDVERTTTFFNKLKLYDLSKNKFYIDELYDIVLYKPFMKLSKIASIIDWDYYDQKFIDAWGWTTLKISNLSGKADYSILDQKIVDGVSHIINYSSKKLRNIQSGIIQNYLLGGFMCLVLIFIVIQQFN